MDGEEPKVKYNEFEFAPSGEAKGTPPLITLTLHKYVELAK